MISYTLSSKTTLILPVVPKEHNNLPLILTFSFKTTSLFKYKLIF